MRTSWLASPTSLLFAATAMGCASPAAQDVSEAVSSSDSVAAMPLVCLVPKEHPHNLNGPVFTVDADRIQRATMFYWHGTTTTLGGLPETPPSETWTVDRSDVADTTVRIEGHEFNGHGGRVTRITVDLVRVADDPQLGWWEQVALRGTLTVVSVLDGSTEVVEIVSGRTCPD